VAIDAVVIGGGVSGMTAAHRLQHAGATVTLVERSGRLGGIVETTVEDGFVIEGGPDSFVTGKGSVLRLAEELGLAQEVIPTRSDVGGSYVWWDGRLHPLPGGLLLMVPSRFGPLLGSALLSWRGKTRVLADLVLPRAGGTEDESLGSFVRRRLGNEVLERIAEPLIAGIHAAEPETMSLAATFPRFLEMEAEHRSLILAARHSASRIASDGLSHFSSFRLGMSQLTTALAGELDQVEVRTNTSVTAIDRSGSARYVASLEDGSKIVASAVVVATPAPVAAGLLERLAPDAARSLSEISQVGTTAVTLAYQSGQLPDLHGSGFVVPSTNGPRIRGVSYLSRKWEGRVPHSGYELIRVFFGAGRTVDQPVDRARQELAVTAGITAEPDRVWVRDHAHGLHRYTLGHPERVRSVDRSLTSCPGVAVAGAGLHGVGLNECVMSGWQAADLALDAVGRSTVSFGDGSR
jgi:protoporphyrinogen/coproporphyrinogen III oxidase